MAQRESVCDAVRLDGRAGVVATTRPCASFMPIAYTTPLRLAVTSPSRGHDTRATAGAAA